MVDVLPDLDDEVAAVRGLARRYGEEKLRPIADAAESDGIFPRQVVGDLGSLGLLGLGFPEELGGSGGSLLGLCVAVEETYRISPGIAASAFMSPLVAYDIYQAGTVEQHQRYLPGILSGRTMAALALTEPDAGSDAASVRTTAVRVDGGWRLDGRKLYITNAGLADIIVVIARTPSEPSGGLSAFIVEMPCDGVTVDRRLDKLGWRASETNAIAFDGCVIPPHALLGEVGQGFKLAMNGFNLERTTLAAGSVGLAQGALDEAVAYAQARVQFGQPLTKLQAVRHTLARCAAQVEAARRLTYHAARVLNEPGVAIQAAAMAKLIASQMCQDVARAAVQVHGGAGFMKEFRVERYYRDSMIMTIGGGTSEIQAEIIGKWLAGREPRGGEVRA